MSFLRPLTRSRQLITRPLSSISTSIPTITSTSIRHSSSSTTKPFPTIATCPSPSCTCAPMPSFPEGFAIDYKLPLNNTMAPYAEQILICTGKDDWASNITDEDEGRNLANGIKELVGRGGEFADPYHNIVTTNASFASATPDKDATSAYLFPSFRYLPSIPSTPDGVHALVRGHLLPRKLHTMHDGLDTIQKQRLLRDEAEGQALEVREMGEKEVLVLICGHGGRDIRCGSLGPLLRTEFERALGVRKNDKGQEILNGAVESDGLPDAKVGLISHIGGHKFAGNVIIYTPPNLKMADGQVSPLAGTGIWYGRVEPKHVEGIVRETVHGGKVIEEFYRGGIGKDGEILRL